MSRNPGSRGPNRQSNAPLGVALVVLCSGCYYFQRKDVELTVRASRKAIRQARSQLRQAPMTGPVLAADKSLYAAERYATSAAKAIGVTLRQEDIPAPEPKVADHVCREIDARTEQLDALGEKITGGLMEKLGYGGGAVGIISLLSAVGLWGKKHVGSIRRLKDGAKGLARLYVADKQAEMDKIDDPIELDAARQKLSQQQEKEHARELVREVLKEAKNGTRT